MAVSQQDTLKIIAAMEAYEQAAFDLMPPAILLNGPIIVKTFGNVKRILGKHSVTGLKDPSDPRLRSVLEQFIQNPALPATMESEITNGFLLKLSRLAQANGESMILAVFDCSKQTRSLHEDAGETFPLANWSREPSDTSALAKAHAELEHNELRFQTAVEGSSVGIIEFDFEKPDWVFAKHVENLLGFEKGAFENSRAMIRSRIHPEDLQNNDAARLAEEQGQDTNLELRLRTKSGQFRWYSINSRVQLGKDGKPKKVIGTISEIDDIKKAQLKAAQDVKRRDEFLAMLSHELRNPMAAITFSLDCLNEMDQLSPDAIQLVEIISRQTTQMSKLMQDLLDVSRLTQNRIDFSFVPHDLNKSVPEVVTSIHPSITKKRQRLHLQLCEEPLMVSGDVSRLKQAIANLLDNAAKYTSEGGEIWLETNKQAGRAVVSVRDSGFGIETSTLGNIFDLFFQANQPLHRKSGGIGVGLFLVDQIVRAHHGEVSADSDGPGHGSHFTISLPLTTDRGNEPATADALMFHGRHVIVVEDNADSRISLTRLLQRRGFQVTEFEDGESAANNLTCLQFDIAIIDIGLPGKNGLELAREIRQHDQLQNALLIAMTGYSQNSDRKSITSAGFNLHVIKPTNVSQLCATIAESLKSR